MKKYIYIIAFFCLFFALPHTDVYAAVAEDAGILDVKNHSISGLPHAGGDGTYDDTAAIQKLAEYAYRNRMILVFPEGTYLVKRQIELKDDQGFGYSDTHSFVLTGSTKGKRPVILLAPNSPDFQSESNPTPLIKLWRPCGLDERHPCDEGQVEESTNFFNSGIRNLEIRIGAGNPGAIAIYHNAHQKSYIEDVTIDMRQSGHTGISATPGMGGSVIGNITILGGQYGITFALNSNRPTVNNIRLEGQTVAALRVSSFFDVVIAGFKIVTAGPTAVEVRNNGQIGTALTLVDGTIDVTQPGDAAAIQNTRQSTVSLVNVYIKTPKNIIDSGSAGVVNGGSDWTRVEQYHVAASANKSAGIVIDGQPQQSSVFTRGISRNLSQNLVPTTLGLDHSWCRQQRSKDHLLGLALAGGQGVCYALDPNDAYDIRRDSGYDNHDQLQAMIDDPACRTVFMPKGNYFIGDTLVLGENTELTGLANNQTHLHPTSDFQRNSAVEWRPTKETPFITTVNSATATTWLSDVRISIATKPEENDWFTALHWKAGRNSVIKTISTKPGFSVNFGTNPKSDVRYSGNGGGKWFGAESSAVVERNASLGKRRLVIDGTSQPLALYNLNIEDGFACDPGGKNSPGNGCPDTAWAGEIINAKNISVYGSKYEQTNTLRVKNSDNISYFGGSRGITHLYENVTRLLIASVKFDDGDKGAFPMIREVYNGQETVVKADTNLGLLARGMVDRETQRISCGDSGTIDFKSTDVNRDGRVTVADLTAVQQKFDAFGVALAEDINNSGQVDIFDYSLVLDDL